MSWDLSLYAKDQDGNEIEVGSWNYTHNTNHMIGAALSDKTFREYWAKHLGPCWWESVHGLTAKDALPVFEQIVDAFEADPEKYQAMDAPNKWGQYKTLLPVFKEIIDGCKQYPSSTIHVSS